MFNLSILATRPPTLSFWKMRSLNCVNSMSVVDIFSVRKKFQIFKPIIAARKIFMVYFQSPGYDAIKSFPYKSVNAALAKNAINAQIGDHVLLTIWSWTDRPKIFIAFPCFAVFYSRCRSYAGVEMRGYFAKLSSLFKHCFSFPNLTGDKNFAPQHSTYPAKIANFIQTFVTQYWLPLFHRIPPSMSMQSKSVFVGGQV